MLITKSKFIAGTQCLKRLYLTVHEPELAVQPNESEQSIIEQGQQVGLLARKIFPGGVTVESKDKEQAIRVTRELIANREVPAIFEGTFEHKDLFVRVDILQRRRDQRWRLIEVKSTTDVKGHHLDDVAIQHRVLSRSGIDLAASCLAHVDREYVYKGGPIDVQHFFKIRNLTRRVKKAQPEITAQLRSEFRILEMPDAPAIASGRQCSDPVTCEFFDHCNTPLPDDHILRLPRIHASTVGKLVALGIQKIHDIPANYPLSARLRHACTSVQTGKPWFSANLKDELKGLKYPLYFMDFETVNPAIPRFAEMHPYDHIPYQWSIHLQRQPGAATDHFEYLAPDNGDPRRAFIASLSDALGDDGSIIVYHHQFESERLSDLASWLPEFSGRIKKIQRRLWDLLPVVHDHVYHPAFGGSYSLKSVLPALVGEMTYKGMEVANGKTAGLVWESVIGNDCGEAERRRKVKALLDYCGQDTFGMVRILELLDGSVRPSIIADARIIDSF
jgi:predicted RecB family nuclease